MLWLIIIGIIAYAAGDQYFEVFKIVFGCAFVVCVFQVLVSWLKEVRARRIERRNARAVRKAQKEVARAAKEFSVALQEVADQLRAEANHSRCSY